VSGGQVVSLGERLRQRRTELGISQAQAARELDVARTAYRLWEMEAAKPAPDRWRLISRWLGISVVALLAADALVDEEEAAQISAAATDFGPPGRWDDASTSIAADFFAQERATIELGLRDGMIQAPRASALYDLLARVQGRAEGAKTHRSRRGEFDKVLPIDPSLPALARASFLVLAAGVPEPILLEGELLTSELVTHAIRRAPAGENVLRLHMVLAETMVRVEVEARTAKTHRPHGSEAWGMTLIMEIASRWGSARKDATNVSWFEIDLPEPGSESFSGADVTDQSSITTASSQPPPGGNGS